MTKKVLSKRKIFYFITLAILFVLICLLAIKLILTFKETKKPENVKKSIDSIELYGYTLSDKATDIYKKYFNELKEVLNEKEINEEEYAKLVAKLFVIDFYTLDNKITSTDIGGIEFIYPSLVDNFKMNAGDTIYDVVESNLYNDRNQVLPIVTDVNIDSIEKNTYKTSEKSLDGYKITCSWDYTSDMGYDKTATYILVKENNKLYIVEN